MRTLRELSEALANVKSQDEIGDLIGEAGESLPSGEMVHFAIAANLKRQLLGHDLLAQRVADLERALHDHVQTVPHAASEA